MRNETMNREQIEAMKVGMNLVNELRALPGEDYAALRARAAEEIGKAELTPGAVDFLGAIFRVCDHERMNRE